ncbi:FAD-dependent oxidoreductase [Arthrobacter woluwensis]|uniref:NADPH-dependent 2,4-dienoyl-CoA reductase, sulfur reductase n=1 Tax=Arthrobacter woluwensis TaxID=156980 RepID=A0A1H4KSP8_9MICC|nr:FAD-dependent oxidoreductase [Arthrobacter woluwensis]SEB61155.1 NADPH-dependent 2,4-dienoyl-CoA reductase, sulfur reductase [Arthrobacter woluwensis]
MRVVIVGGVAAGMSAAARARRLDEDAEIVVLERGRHVSFANCGLPYYVGGEILEAEDLLLHNPASLRAALNIDVRLEHSVIGLDASAHHVTVETPAGEQQIHYDELILAPGASVFRPAIPGLDSPRVHTLRTVDDALAHRTALESGARHAVVLGGGFIGVEAAEAFAAQGLKVDLVTRGPHILSPVEAELAALVTTEASRLGITVHSNATVERIVSGDTRDTVVLSDGHQVQADLLVLAAGVRPDTAIFEKAGVACERGAIVVDEYGRTNLPGVYAAGDATLQTDHVTGTRHPVTLAGPANRSGRQVADHLVRPESARPAPATTGTAIIRVGELTAATTGANRASLRKAGVDHQTLHLHPSNHAGYFPGATPLSLVVHIRKDDGLLLGAQAVGKEGVDKRIDVLATAIRAEFHVADLIDLDLAYSPIYGSAKDPVNLVGMVGQNALDGTLRLWYAEEWEHLRHDALILDVRSRDEYASGHLPGSLNIPHTELRGRLDELKATVDNRPVRVLCGSGVRSHIAHRVLDHAGFDSASLSGGMQTARAILGDHILHSVG